jgi:hypothetical protein
MTINGPGTPPGTPSGVVTCGPSSPGADNAPANVETTSVGSQDIDIIAFTFPVEFVSPQDPIFPVDVVCDSRPLPVNAHTIYMTALQVEHLDRQPRVG